MKLPTLTTLIKKNKFDYVNSNITVASVSLGGTLTGLPTIASSRFATRILKYSKLLLSDTWKL